ncbi:N-acetyltransferase [Flavobacteriaceae bacterium]|jgi:predicted GNAT family acetyltransferase|nr:N-acetyltransferase [Bacteroidota bacterium]MDB4028671.1 N-acetyltransferase [Flavobacteriaceae bacterium]MDG1502426.1 N-acetyltransferase [Ulvibacter sp.]MBT5870813.1 N-acetyltransferase [Bacteroidota bacterium]MDB9828552.1 N-acetyltransferase [Flavobacteriaceae bacterium]|tara:strand:+ start:479 stop:778 length:300 start_codon:yes stop_codon:yes gene_type:complete
MIEDVEITDNEFLRQFELEIGDNMARIEYALQDRKIFLTKYEMPEDLEDQGFRDIFIKAVFDEVRDRGISVMPTSPEVVGFLRKNRRKYKDLLPVGINI